jgi:pimeloyl-ACP methyl ester carboxylesterase
MNRISLKKKTVIFIIIAFLLLLIVAPLPITAYIHNRTFGQRAESPQYRAFLTYYDVEGFERRSVSFPSGSNMLRGFVYGEENDKGLVVISHSFGDGEQGYFNVIMYFVDKGWRVFTYDKTGSHNSEGSGTVGLTQPVLDLDAALTFIAEQGWDLPIMLFGHSMGGFASTAVLNFEHGISAVVSLAGYNEPMGVLLDMGGHIFGGLASLTRPYIWVHQRLIFGRSTGLSAVDGINRSNVPVMIIHGTDDMLILYDSAAIINYRDEITNPNVQFITHYAPHHNSHMNLLASIEASEYINELNNIFINIYNLYISEKYEACPFISIHYHQVHMLTNRNLARCFCTQVYSISIPEDVLSDFYAGIDKQRTSALNLPLMDKINDFFENSVS